MAEQDIAQVSFGKGEVSPVAAARTDAQFYAQALGGCVNFFIQVEGGTANRPGLEFIAPCITNVAHGSYLLPFVYNNEQSYVCECATDNITIYYQGQLVQAVVSPFLIGDLPNLRWAQSADVLNVVVGTKPLQQLTRGATGTFSLSAPQLLFGPFQDLNTDGTTTVYVSGTQGTVTIIASDEIFFPGHVGALFSVKEQYLAAINPWQAEALLTAGANSPVGYMMRSDNKIYTCCAAQPSADNYATGQYQPVHTQGTVADGNGQAVPSLAAVSGVEWQFVSTDTGVALITEYISRTQVVAVVQNYKGVWANFPPTVVGGPQPVVGPFTFSGDGTTTVFSGLTAITTSDPNQFYVKVGGVFQDPSTYFINLGATSITFFSPPAVGAANVVVSQVTGTIENIYTYSTGALTPMTGLCLSTYWAFGSISPEQGFASDVCYYNDRLVLSGTPLQPQTFWCSQVSDYLNFGVSDPQVDSDGITETINSRQQNPIVNLLPMNNLLLGTASASWRATDTSGLGAITPSNISLIPQEFYGMEAVPAVQTGTTIIYVQWGGRKIRDIIYNFYTDKFMGQELTLYARQMFPYGTTALRAAYAPEPYGLLFVVRSDGVLCVCAYVPTQPSLGAQEGQLVAWSRYITQGNFEDVQVVPENGSFSVYVIVGRYLAGGYIRQIEKFSQREYETIDDAFFVDSGLTYDGRSATYAPGITMALIGGTTWLAGSTAVLAASSASGWVGFVASDATNNNGVWLYDAAGNRCRLQITEVTSAFSTTVMLLDPAPIDLQGMQTGTWTFVRTTFSGLLNLQGETVSIFADGAVLAQQVVSPVGTLTLASPGGVVHAGLPYNCQLQSLNLNVQGQETIRNHEKTIPRVSVVVDESYPFAMGPDFVHLNPVVQRTYEAYGTPVTPYTGVLPVTLGTQSQDDATVCLQMSDPAPVRVLSWIASVDIGDAQ